MSMKAPKRAYALVGPHLLCCGRRAFPLYTFCLCVFSLTCSCAPGKAYIDHTGEGSLIWPAGPEKPRIRYLWALKTVEAVGDSLSTRGLGDLLMGRVEDDVSDPRSSNTLMRPYGIFVDGGRIYVADPGAARVTVVNRTDGRTIQLFELDGEKTLDYPTGVVADAAGRIYVADPNQGVVAVFNREGKFQSYLEGKFGRPVGLAYDAGLDRLYVVDAWAHNVIGYDAARQRTLEVGGRGQEGGLLNYPSHAFVDKTGLLYVTDTLNFKIKIFSPDGTLVNTLGTYGDAYSDLDRPKGVAVDSEGHIYVADAGRDMVKIFDKEGRLLLFLGSSGRMLGQFAMPGGLFMDVDDVLYVADVLNMRVQAFQYLKGGDGP